MNIYAEKGDKVIFTCGGGYDFQKEKAKELLKIGHVYTVKNTQVYAWNTDVFLVEFPDVAFNSVLFEDFKEGGLQ